MAQSIRKQLIDALSDANGQYLSGQALADMIGCSRTAIWKHIEDLRNTGFEVEAVRKKGYRIVTIPDNLTENEILLGLETSFIGRQIIHHESVPSTQLVAHQMAMNGADEGTVVIAEEQTAGKGRLSRKWHSPKRTGIWMSFIVKPHLPLEKAPQFTLVTAIAAVRAIKQVCNLEVEIKWPNDILYKGKKIAGILTEVQGDADQINFLIIGIGINVNHTEDDFPKELKDSATSLAIATGKNISRKDIIQEILKNFEKYYDIYLKQGFAPLKIIWEAYSNTIGKTIIARTFSDVITGEAIGITDEGVLQIKDEKGNLQHVYSADIEINDSDGK